MIKYLRQRSKIVAAKISTRQISYIIILLLIILIGFLLWRERSLLTRADYSLNSTMVAFMFVGFVAQLVDGALGMAYGVSCSTLLLSFGVSPKIATSSVHIAEVFTTGVSGLSHLRFRNIDKQLFFRLVITGVAGSAAGAYLISEVFDGKMIKPFVAAYLLILGAIILYKGIKNKIKHNDRVRHAEILALFGGFLDAVGGGGWGPIVTSNLINQGKNPRETIGTVNTAEFFVSFFSTGVFLVFIGVQNWRIILGLIIGGVIAAPIGAYFAAKVNRKTMMILIGVLIILTSCYTIYKALV